MQLQEQDEQKARSLVLKILRDESASNVWIYLKLCFLSFVFRIPWNQLEHFFPIQIPTTIKARIDRQQNLARELQRERLDQMYATFGKRRDVAIEELAEWAAKPLPTGVVGLMGNKNSDIGIIDMDSNGNAKQTCPEKEKSPQKEESIFEVNMVEPLIGWKALCVKGGKLFSSQKTSFLWPVDAPATAWCGDHNEPPPCEFCQCGIYATTLYDAAGYTERGTNVLAQVYGWGKYVRGDRGWRAQYAYPKCLHLQQGQELFIEPLKAYHVPIFMDMVQVYNPEEDGYVRDRDDEENRDCRADEEPSPGEETAEA